MIRPLFARQLVWIVPVALLLVSFGRLVADPSSLLVDANRPTVDRARVVAAPPGNDLTRQFLPLQRWIARTLGQTGAIPQWDDRGFGGRPLVGNPQAGLFYPPTWIAWLVPAPSTLGWITLGHLVWATLGMIRLGRTLGLSEEARSIAAGCFVLSPYVLSQTYEGHYPHVWAICWYPWAFDSTIWIGRGWWRSGLDLAVVVASVLLVGHAQEGYYLLIALGFWAGADLIRRVASPGDRGRIAPMLAVWAGVGVLAVGLVAVEVIPDAMAQGWTLRSARMPLRLASRYHPAPINALQLFHPFALGGPADYFGPENYWETVVSIGLAPLVLAGVGATWTVDRRRVRGWWILVVAATVFASGRKLGLFALMYETIPGMDRFRVPSRSLFLANLGAAVLVGFGVEALGNRRESGPDRWVRLGKRWICAVVLLLVAVGWGAGRTARANLDPAAFGSTVLVEEVRSRPRSSSEWDRYALGLDHLARQPTFWLAVLGTSAVLAWGRLQPHRRHRLAVGFGLLGLVELAGSGHQLLVTSSPAAFLGSEAIENAVRRACPDRDGQPPVRIRADEAIVSDLVAVELGWNKTDINDTFQIQSAADIYQRLYDLSRPRAAPSTGAMDGPAVDRARRTQQAILDRMGVALVFVDRTSPRLEALVEATRWPIVASVPTRDGRVVVARNPSAMPRAYVVPRAEVVSGGEDVVDRFAEVDPKQAVLMDHDPLAGVPAESPREPFRGVDWEATDPDRLAFRVETQAPSLLVVADTWMPGWSAWVDGRPAEVERGNHAQRVIPLPRAGRHEVVLSYQAPGFRIGRMISLGSVVVWAALWVVGRFRGRVSDSSVI